MSSNILYLGAKAHVVAIDKTTGATLWRTKLKGGTVGGQSFVSLLVHEGRVFAHTYGELFCLDQQTGAILWKNALEGLGYDLATLAAEGATTSSAATVTAMQRKKAQEAAATAV